MDQKKALIIKFGQIGDVIMVIPAVRALHEKGFEIHWVCGQAALPLLESYSWINLIPINDRAILRGRGLERITHILGLWRKVAFKKYDICATLYYDFRFHLLALPVRGSRKVVLSKKSRSTTLLAGRHHTDEFARVLLELEDGYREQSRSPVRPDRVLQSLWSANKILRRIAIVPGGASNVMGQQTLRRWPIERYVVLAEMLIRRGWQVVLLGAAEDAWVKPYFQHLTTVDCLGLLSLPEVISACDACDAVISHDTGPLHLAGISKTCLIGIFGPTNPATFLPRRASVVGIWGGQGFACRPCYDGRDFAPCQFNGCMHQVTPELVLRELDQLLDAHSQGLSTPWKIVSPEGTSLPGKEELVTLA